VAHSYRDTPQAVQKYTNRLTIADKSVRRDTRQVKSRQKPCVFANYLRFFRELLGRAS